MRYPTPLYETLHQHVQKGFLRLHMPGHAGHSALENFLPGKLAWDLTELPGLDDWHAPRGCIAEANRLLAAAYKAPEAVQLINGSSSGIEALFLALFKEGDQVIVPRAVHRSFYSGFVLSGATPVYIPLQYHMDWPVALITEEAALTKLYATPQAAGIFLVDPTFYGICMSLSRIAAAAKEKGIPLLVDQAHGAHFAFHPEYPPTAMAQGADAVVYGMHKTLPVLTPGAALVWRESCWNDRIHQALSLFNTTSPSYPLLASMDWGRAFMQEEGEAYLCRAELLSRHYRREFSVLEGLRVLHNEYNGAGDYLKVVLGLEGWALNGYELAQRLREDFAIQVEMVEERVITAMMSLFHQEADWEHLRMALSALAQEHGGTGSGFGSRLALPALPEMALTPKQAYYAQKRSVKLADSSGKIAGSLIVPYPPGIPLLVPGEVIGADIIDYILMLEANGHHLQGLAEQKPLKIDIIE